MTRTAGRLLAHWPVVNADVRVVVYPFDRTYSILHHSVLLDSVRFDSRTPHSMTQGEIYVAAPSPL